MSHENYRPGYHFTPARNWMNDPNGLVYVDDTYHLFFQYNPEAEHWGNMSWGHATSPNLVDWTEHPVAILHEETEAIFSGSIVVDHNNTSGFGDGSRAPLVAIYTSAYTNGRQAQSLAFSTDKGTSWTKYSGNPVLDRESTAFRDPKVFWYVGGNGEGNWVMVAVEAEERTVVLYRSHNLRTWTALSTFNSTAPGDGLWECPDLFPLPIDSDASQVRWVLIVSVDQGRASAGTSTRYFLGDFDGVSFSTTQPAPALLDWGPDFYAAVSYDNAPDNRRILIGWMSNWNYAAMVPTHPWRGSMSLPRELSLETFDGTVGPVQRLPRELQRLTRAAKNSIGPFTLEGTRLVGASACYRLDVTFTPSTAAVFGLDLLVGDNAVTSVRYDVIEGVLSLDRTSSGIADFEASFASAAVAPLKLRNGALQLTVYVDRGSVEVFAQAGATTLTAQVFTAATDTGLAIVSQRGTTRIERCDWTAIRTEFMSNGV